MPEPLPGTVTPEVIASGTGALGIAAVWDAPPGAIRGVSGVPVPARGSIAYEHAVSFGFLVGGGGWFDFQTRGGSLRGQLSGLEDGKRGSSR
jgi:hypothetical protein